VTKTLRGTFPFPPILTALSSVPKMAENATFPWENLFNQFKKDLNSNVV